MEVRDVKIPQGLVIDSLGNRMAGLENLGKAWTGYFKMVPDYSISDAAIFADRDTVAMFGSAQGTFSKSGEMKKEDFWKNPAAWHAVVRDGKNRAVASLRR